MQGGRNKLYLVGVVLAIGLFIAFKNNLLGDRGRRDWDRPEQEQTGPAGDGKQKEDSARDRDRRPPSDEPGRETGFNRRAGKLIYTKHARCRMACRHIDESEVQEILETGTVNDRKSEPAARPDPKYALEGRTHDGQQVRIVFAPSARGMVVITVIDLGTDWSCDCK